MAAIQTRHLLSLSLLLHLILILYADHVDSHPERFGGLKYTDVDWRVVVDGARYIFQPTGEAERAKGWLGEWLWIRGWCIGDPYLRQTFRYTPLLPVLLSPALIHPLLGKLALSLISLSVPLLLLSEVSPHGNRPAPSGLRQTGSSRRMFWATHLIWTFNPFVLNITTRGSPEAIIVFLVVLLVKFLGASRVVNNAKDQVAMRLAPSPGAECLAAITLALAASYKIYPIIYVPAVWSNMSARRGVFGWPVWRFGAVAAVTAVLVNGLLWSIWGYPFLEHTFLYHLSRKDHRHNFSPYFYPTYLSFFASDSDSPLTATSRTLAALRHPLASFVPQMSLVLGSGWLLSRRTGLESAMLVQTIAFVVFNKVCTSQYFIWFLPLIPPVIDQMHLTPKRAIFVILLWVAGQALWLAQAYQLELKAQNAFLTTWAAGLVLFAGSVFALGAIIDSLGLEGRDEERGVQGHTR